MKAGAVSLLCVSPWLCIGCRAQASTPQSACPVAGFWFATERINGPDDGRPQPPAGAFYISDRCETLVRFYSDVGPLTSEWERSGTIYFRAETLVPAEVGWQLNCGDVPRRIRLDESGDLLVEMCGVVAHFERCPAEPQPAERSYDQGCREYARYREHTDRPLTCVPDFDETLCDPNSDDVSETR